MVKRVAPFQGQVFEGFESVASSTELTNLMDGMMSFAGAAGETSLTIQNGDYFNLWDQHAFEGHNFLGGAAGYGVPATIEMTFACPVNGFGGLFGHRVRPSIESAGETEFVFYDARDREFGRDKVFIGSSPGSVAAYWKFSRGVKRITATCVHPMADAVTARLSAVQYKKFSRSVQR